MLDIVAAALDAENVGLIAAQYAKQLEKQVQVRISLQCDVLLFIRR
jgi:hypothetical protein